MISGRKREHRKWMIGLKNTLTAVPTGYTPRSFARPRESYQFVFNGLANI